MLQATLLSFLVMSLFTIDDFTTYLLFFVVVAFSFVFTVKSRRSKRLESILQSEKLKKVKAPSFALLTLLSVLVLYSWGVNPLLANRDVNLAEYYASTGDCQRAVYKAERGFDRKGPIHSYVAFQAGIIYGRCIEDERLADQQVFTAMESSAQHRPAYTRTWTNLGTASVRLLKHEREKDYFFQKAVDSFQKAEQLSPHRAFIKDELALLYLKDRNYTEAKKKAGECLGLEKRGQCYFTKGMSLVFLEDDFGEEFLRKARGKEYSVKNGIISLVVHLGYYDDYEAMIPYYLILIEEDPDDYENYHFLAFAYEQIGEEEKAEEYRRKGDGLRE